MHAFISIPAERWFWFRARPPTRKNEEMAAGRRGFISGKAIDQTPAVPIFGRGIEGKRIWTSGWNIDSVSEAGKDFVQLRLPMAWRSRKPVPLVRLLLLSENRGDGLCFQTQMSTPNPGPVSGLRATILIFQESPCCYRHGGSFIICK